MIDGTQAVVISAPGEVGLSEVKLKAPGPGDVIVRTRFTSISAGTERMLLAGQMPHPMLSLPVVPGYETVGRIEEIGENVDPEWLGREVYVGGALCYEDVNSAWGGQAARLFADVERVVPLDGIEAEQGVMLALAATAQHGIDRAAIRTGERVLVLGQGPVGQLAARIARHQGAHVTVTDLVESRLAHAVADKIVDGKGQTLDDALGEPVQVIIEATGSMDALAAALSHLDMNGRIVLLGYYTQVTLPYMPLFLKEAHLIAAKEWAPNDLTRCRDMIAHDLLDVAPLITHRHSIRDVKGAYETALNDPDCLKILLEWPGT
jgi:3-hydroxyethyl bacteriochlorophyllide a dehydrogenase